MKQAVKKVKIAKNTLADGIYASALSQKSEKVQAQKSNVIPLDRATSLSRYLEACGDCV